MTKDNREDRKAREHEGTKEVEGREGGELKNVGVKIPSPLSFAAERAIHQTIGCAIAVHRELGPGFLESIYRKAMCLELDARGLAYERERAVRVTYRGVEIPGQRVDLIIEGLIVVELKSVATLVDVHRAQLISYLRTTGLRGGLLINFDVRLLKDGIQRVVL